MTSPFLTFNTLVFEWCFFYTIQLYTSVSGLQWRGYVSSEEERDGSAYWSARSTETWEPDIGPEKQRRGNFKWSWNDDTFKSYNCIRCRRRKPSNKTIQKFRNEIPEDKFHIIIYFFQYKTARSGGKELQAILHKRKEMADRKDDSVEVADYSDSESKWLMKYNPM